MSEDYKKAGASYILRFYDDVANLTHFYSLYQSAILELEARYPKFEETNKFLDVIEEHVKNNYLNILQNLRHHINTSYISYKSIILQLKQKEGETIAKLYKTINANYIIKTEDAFSYTQELNNFLLSEILKELLDNSANLLNNIYGNSTKTPSG